MTHIKTENGWSLFVESQPVQHLYMVKFLTTFERSKEPNELREANRFFFTRDELERFVDAIKQAINEPAQ